MLPPRIHTGIKNVTIPNPAILFQNSGAKVFQGIVTKYDFERQTRNFIALDTILKENNIQFSYIGSAHYRNYDHKANHHRFVVTTKCGTVVWHKYVANHPQSGQNHLFMCGIRIKVSRFLRLSPEKQRALLSGDKLICKLLFKDNELSFLNEHKLRWC
jgi:hypothetical protein